jgi:hypothetical protein
MGSGKAVRAQSPGGRKGVVRGATEAGESAHGMACRRGLNDRSGSRDQNGIRILNKRVRTDFSLNDLPDRNDKYFAWVSNLKFARRSVI